MIRHSPLNTTIVVSLLVLAACERAPTDLTAPEPQAKTLDAPSLSPLAASATWTLDAPMPTARRSLKAATVNGIIYAIGGFSTKVEAYDVASNTWTLKKALPEPLAPNGATNINGKIYVAGGQSTERYSKALYVYNPTTNGWTRKADMPFTVASLAGQQGAINGKLYVYAGVTINPDGSVGPHRFSRYNPATNTWATLGRPSYARRGGASGVINGRFYLVGGTVPTSRNGWGKAYDVHIYDPATGWSKKPLGQYGQDSWGLASAPQGGKLYIVGTNYSDYCYYDVSGVYDPASNTMLRFSSRAPLRWGAAGAAAKGQFFVIGGSDYEPDNGGCGDGNGSLTGEVRAYTP
jgi:N-acetylneuraminic acid mutarotase